AILLSSHLLAEVEQIASHIGVLQAGRLRYQGRLDALRDRLRGRLLLETEQHDIVIRHLADFGERAHRTSDGRIEIIEPRRSDAELLRRLVEFPASVSSFHRERPTLESLFFDLTTQSETKA
ncbi:MAG: bacitracin ABC transporter ATP-binding protein, partial [Luteimonas sp.]